MVAVLELRLRHVCVIHTAESLDRYSCSSVKTCDSLLFCVLRWKRCLSLLNLAKHGGNRLLEEIWRKLLGWGGDE
ncbi:hypothetical protein K1719_029611 [Acacia pycnantha]|nr:hypothetical protein K1719_029611 [Acacia pycnantha]